VSTIYESDVEEFALQLLNEMGYGVAFGPDIEFGAPGSERLDAGFGDVVLEGRLRDALDRLNAGLSPDALDDAFRKLTQAGQSKLLLQNQAIHRMLVEGVPVEDTRPDGSVGGTLAQVIDFENPERNDWLAVNQFTVQENRHHRRPDVVVFVNGLPLVVIELKNPADEQADVWGAWGQLQTYQAEIPSLFNYNVALIASDATMARIGTIAAGKEWFKPWRTISGREPASASTLELQVMLEGVLEKRRLLQLVRHFIVFEDEGAGKIIKKMAGYHQFHAVNVAVEETLRALAPVPGAKPVREGRYEAGVRPGGESGDRRVGVVWHTQGSGKSLTMAFYAGRIILHPAMENPTVLVLTDRNDLDDQLFATFGRCRELLRQPPEQAEDREDLRKKLQVSAGGVVFTTIQKFLLGEGENAHPVLSDRRNIVVMADEAHRSQYGFIDGFARRMREALPNASFIGFTGTPVEKTDANTRQVFGEHISVYDIQQAVVDKATVPIYYEGRLAKLELKDSKIPRLDNEFEEATEGEEVSKKEALKTKWAQLEAVVGAEKRIKLIAKDLVDHWERRLAVMDGKAMVVAMSRRIAVELYNAIVALRPDWHSPDDEKGRLKVVMTGSATDPVGWQQHIRNKPKREALAKRFRDPTDPFQVVIVRDMWLTGFDAPSLHTMYADKPMQGHGLMQAIARVNRVFKDKPGGLVVDYLGLADDLKRALATYTASGGSGKTAIDQEEAVAAMLARYEVCTGLLHKFNWSSWKTGSGADRIKLLAPAQEQILAQKEGRDRWVQAVRELSQAFALAVPHEEALRIRDDVEFFQAVRAVLVKALDGDGRQTSADLDAAIRQIVSGAVASDQVIDIFAAAGLKKPDISILSDDFLADVRGMPQRNLAVELLRKLLTSEIRGKMRKNVVQARSFGEMLKQAVLKYQARAIETAQVIEELIALAKEVREAEARGEMLGLNSDEVAFYDALGTSESAVQVMGDDQLKIIARELVKTVRENASIDWTLKESVRAKLRVMVKRILKRYGYPPDLQEKATDTVLEQAEVLTAEWAPI
jgi:type I restriction enzyme R subunit